MKVEIYGKMGCAACVTAKQFCEGNGIDYEYKVLNKDYSITDMYAIAPMSHRTFPMLALDGEYVGTLDDLREKFYVKS